MPRKSMVMSKAERAKMAGWASRTRFKDLRASVDQARKRKLEAVAHADALCELASRRLQRSIAARRAALEAEIAAERSAATALCQRSKARARATGDEAVVRAKDLLRWEKTQRPTKRQMRGSALTAAERRQESDSEVAQNIGHEFLPVWNKVRRHIRAGERSSRTEAFYQWMHDHPSEVERITIDHAERLAAATEPESEEDYRARTSSRTAQDIPDDEVGDVGDAGDDDVPF
jgi:hypothetical protein